MHDLQRELAETINRFSLRDGLHESPVSGVYCVKYSQTDLYAKRQWRACLAIVAQGCKEVVIGREVYRCSAARYTATPIHLPVISRVSAAASEKPFLAILIDLEPFVLSEMASQLENNFLRESVYPARAFFSGDASENMLEATIRLAKLFQRQEDAQIIAPLVIREVFYYLLKGPEGLAIRQYVRSGSKMQKIAQAIQALRSELSKEIDVSALAKTANMSRSAFFKCFKEITAMSPIQYQKRLRLLEAKRLMLEAGETAESSAFKVGYKSSSQFSREYSRMFGNAPLRDALKTRESNSRSLQF